MILPVVIANRVHMKDGLKFQPRVFGTGVAGPQAAQPFCADRFYGFYTTEL